MKKLIAVFGVILLLLTGILSAHESNTDRTGANLKTDIQDSLAFLPQGSVISSRDVNKIICFLPGNTMVQGLLCHGHKHDYQTVFYTNGNLSLAWLVNDTVIQGIPCAAASFWTEILRGSYGSAGVHFHPNGKLSQCKLSRDFKIDEHTFKKGDVLHFDEVGNLVIDKK